MRAARLLMILGATLALVLAALPAQADTVTRRDRANDAAARVDVTRPATPTRPTRISALARIPDLGRAGDASISITRYEVCEAGYVLRITKRAGQRPRVRPSSSTTSRWRSSTATFSRGPGTASHM